MKEFKIPEVEIVYFSKKDVIATSGCPSCDDCGECLDGGHDCRTLDFD